MHCRVKLLNEMWEFLRNLLAIQFPGDPKIAKRNLVSCCRNKTYDIEILKPPSKLNEEQNCKFQQCLEELFHQYKLILEPVVKNESVFFAGRLNRTKIFKPVIKKCLQNQVKYETGSGKIHLVFCLLDNIMDSLPNLRCLTLGQYTKKQKERFGTKCILISLPNEKTEFSEMFSKFFPFDTLNFSLETSFKEKMVLESEQVRKKYPIMEHGTKNMSLHEISLLNLVSSNQYRSSSELHSFTTKFIASQEAEDFLSAISAFTDQHDIKDIECTIICSNLNQVKATQINLYQRLVLENKSLNIDHVIYNCGNKENGFECFMNLRLKQNKQNLESKHFEREESTSEDEILKSTIATVSLQLQEISLTTVFQTDGISNTKASFILYNYARLYTLVQAYESKVKNGKYPSLPNIGLINFDLLREDAEWFLVRDGLWLIHEHLHSFVKPHIVSSTTHKMFSQEVPYLYELMVNYLHKLCTLTSSFYSKHHILDDNNLTHLQPVMFARIYLVKSVIAAMDTLFLALNVVPLQKM